MKDINKNITINEIDQVIEQMNNEDDFLQSMSLIIKDFPVRNQ